MDFAAASISGMGVGEGPRLGAVYVCWWEGGSEQGGIAIRMLGVCKLPARRCPHESRSTRHCFRSALFVVLTKLQRLTCTD